MMDKKNEENDIDAIALKRELSLIFNENFLDKDGSISLKKLKEAEREYNIPERGSKHG